jgi:hypothetical protein
MRRDQPGGFKRIRYAANHTVTYTDLREFGHIVGHTHSSGLVFTMPTPSVRYDDWELRITNDGSANNITLSGSAAFIKGSGTYAIGPGCTQQLVCKQDYSGTYRWQPLYNSTDADVTAVGAIASGGSGIADTAYAMASGSSGKAVSGFNMSSGVSGLAQSGFNMASGSSGAAALFTADLLSVSGVADGGSGIAATAGTVASGASGIAAGGSGIAAGGSGIAAGASGIATGGSGIAAGGSGIAAGASGIAAGGSGMAAAASGAMFGAWTTWSGAQTWSGGLAPNGITWVGRYRSGTGGIQFVGCLDYTDGSGAILQAIAPPVAPKDIDAYLPYLVHQQKLSGATTTYNTSGVYALFNQANVAGTFAFVNVEACPSQWSGRISFQGFYEV